jgi:pyrroline-5-carboxylate reductase
VRLMPNMPVILGKGAIGLASDSPDERAAATALMAPLGLVEWLDAEDDFHALTALSGSGPAFVYRFIDALAAAGRDLGLSADQSLRLARATVEGAGALAAISEEDPGLLADRVASPGGTTREGLNVLDAESAILTLTAKALAAAERRSREMAEEAKRI